MTEYLLDTNVVTELRKPRPHGAVLAWFHAVPAELLFISTVTFGELQAGVELTRRQNPAKAAELEKWLDRLSTSSQAIPMDVDCFREWARLMRGKSEVLSADAMLAATARVHHLTVVTRNERDFRQFGVPVLNPFTTK